MLSLKTSHDYSSESLLEFRVVSLAYAGMVYRCVMQGQDRIIMLRGLELLHKLTSELVRTDNAFVLNTCPDDLLETLASLVCASNTSLESVSLVSTTPCFAGKALSSSSSLSSSSTSSSSGQVVSTAAVPACAGLFFNDLVDGELRDVAMDVVCALCEQNQVMQVRFGRIPGFCLLILKMVQSRHSPLDKPPGRQTKEDERSRKAIALLKAFASRPENLSTVMSLGRDAVVAGVRDELIGEFLSTLSAIILAQVPHAY